MASLLGGLGDRFPQHNRHVPFKAPPLAAGIFTVNKVEFCGMLMRFVYHRFHADRELSLLAGHAHPVGIDTANCTPLAMRVSRRECLQAGCNDCECIGNEREQSVRLIGNESEQRNAIHIPVG